jgi:hypothetical protein
MQRDEEIPDLLAKYMEQWSKAERWVTVYEFRTCFDLDRSSASAVSGFLCRIYRGPFYSFPYRVKKIEKIFVHAPQRRSVNRYLVKKSPEPGKERAGYYRIANAQSGMETRLTETGNHEFCTDLDAVEIFNRVLGGQTRNG